MSSKLKKVLISVFCSLFLVQNAFAAQFVDVIEQSLFYDAITYFTTEVPILATDRDTFKPLDKVTKAEFFKLLVESGGYGSFSESYDIPFYDVTGTEWFAPYIDKALNLNVVEFTESVPDFYPGNTVTRAEAIDWVVKFYGIDQSVVSQFPLDYNDVSPLDPFANLSKIAYQLKLLHDYKSKEFNAEKELTRAEAIHIFYQVHQNDLELSIPVADSGEDALISVNDANFALFYDVWNKVNNDYIDMDEIDKNDLIYGAISGMVYKLNDPYSVFFEPIDADTYMEALEGEFDGIGIYLNQEGKDFVILTPLKGSPAEEAGLKPNDIIIEVDEVPVSGIEIEELIEMLRGVTGTQVKLKIKRDGKYYFKYVTRSHIDIPDVESELIDDVGVIYYYQFTGNSHQQFTVELDNLLAHNPKGLVLDLRNNPGGYLYSAQQLVSRFIPSDQTYINITLASGVLYSENSLGPGDLQNTPLVVLINEGSASASEIAALALRDQKGTTIVGAQSYGKEKIQEILSYSDGSSLKLSIANWTSPTGTSVANTGITPDYLVELSDYDFETGNDKQLTKALQLIN